MFFFVVSVAFLFGMLFRTVLTLEADFKDISKCDNATGFFLTCFNMLDKEPYDDFIAILYFSFTTLSTVGLGDYYPKSDIERMMYAFFMLFGVATFSYIMGNFITILSKFQLDTQELGEEELLQKLMLVLKKFNQGIPLDTAFTTKMEDYFRYKWEFDTN